MRRSVFDMYIAVMRFSINLEENIVVIFSEYMASMLLPSNYVVTEHAPDLTYLSRPEHEAFCTERVLAFIMNPPIDLISSQSILYRVANCIYCSTSQSAAHRILFLYHVLYAFWLLLPALAVRTENHL